MAEDKEKAWEVKLRWVAMYFRALKKVERENETAVARGESSIFKGPVENIFSKLLEAATALDAEDVMYIFLYNTGQLVLQRFKE